MKPSELLRSRMCEVRDVFENHPFAKKPRIFGSVARGDDTEDSDIDILIDIEPFTSFFAIAELQNELEDLFLEVKIDLIDSYAVKGQMLEEIQQDIMPL
ncbi:TPA: nucleotidyltransferase family protein [Neisseria lactamica]